MSLKAKDINDQTKWQDLTEGLKIFEPATSKQFETGEWRTQTPEFNESKCKQCLLCVPYCPDSCIPVVEGQRRNFDLMQGLWYMREGMSFRSYYHEAR